MKGRGTIAVDTVNDRVDLQFSGQGRSLSVSLTAAQARELADAVRAAADFADAAGKPHGHA